ncbi:MAG: LON peptidase substrate-binding domain-containing protein [Gemmatimonadota bacterium]
MKLPLFPLNAVLFPEGVLPLRVFEARYMDMVRDCLQSSSSFGVCLITSGRETGKPAQCETTGCMASIAAWDMQQLGVLHIRTVGTRRFRVLHAAPQANGLLVGDVDEIEPDVDAPLAPEHQPCAALLARIIDDLDAQREAARRASPGNADALASSPIERPYRMESTVWVGNRLCEVLPVSLRAKQKLMELEDAKARLDIVLRFLRQHAVVQ